MVDVFCWVSQTARLFSDSGHGKTCTCGREDPCAGSSQIRHDGFEPTGATILTHGPQYEHPQRNNFEPPGSFCFPLFQGAIAARGSQFFELPGLPLSLGGFFLTPSFMCANLQSAPYEHSPVFLYIAHVFAPSGVRLCPLEPVVSTTLGLDDLFPGRTGATLGDQPGLLQYPLGC